METKINLCFLLSSENKFVLDLRFVNITKQRNFWQRLIEYFASKLCFYEGLLALSNGMNFL